MEYPYETAAAALARRDEFVVTRGRHSTLALFYMKEGAFSLDFGNGIETITAGDCVIMPDHINFSRHVITPIVFVYIKFRTNERAPLTLHLPYGKVTPTDKDRFLYDIRQYEELLECTDDQSVLYREHLLTDMLMQLALKTPASDPLRTDECSDMTVAAALAFIRDNLFRKLTVADICAAIGSNPSTLNFKCRRWLQTSVINCLIAERMRLARRLLSGTTDRIADVAVKCGYENIYYFSQAFRKHTGETPGSYRKRFR